MVTLHLIPEDIAADYDEVHEWQNATGILQTRSPERIDVIAALRAFKFQRSELLKGGGAKSIIAQRIDRFLARRKKKSLRPTYV